MTLEKATLQHLRFPFSILLMPVFLLATAELTHASRAPLDWIQLGAAFFVLHALVYPASNGYNSWCDQDEGPIGGVLDPLKPPAQLKSISLALDITALALAASLISIPWAGGLLTYIIASRIYSHPAIRLKAKPWLGWWTVALFQGPWIVGLVFAASGGDSVPPVPLLIGSALLFGGGYPITQIYQHEEDARRGDLTLSRKLGVTGTLAFAGFASTLGALALLIPWLKAGNLAAVGLLFLGLLPGSTLLARFTQKCFANPDFVHSGRDPAREVHRLSWALALGLNLAFLGLLLTQP
jgi:1,4-dihydroxy-2-naphthoate octaprenyltransferase